MSDFVPWEKYPALTLDRLIVVANAIREGRHSAVEDYQPSKGDDSWVLGCTAYKRSCFQLGMVAREHSSWFSIIKEENNRFTFSVGSIPLKLYQGPANDPPSRSLAISYAELINIQQCLDFGVIPTEGYILRLAVETDEKGDSKSVILVELEGGNVSGVFRIPEGGATILPMRPPAIDPGAPTFTPREQEERIEMKRKATGTEGDGR